MARTTQDGDVFLDDLHIGHVEKAPEGVEFNWESVCQFCGSKAFRDTKSAAVDTLEEHFHHEHVAPEV